MDTSDIMDKFMKDLPNTEYDFLPGTLESNLCHLRTMFWGKALPTAPVWNLEMLERQLKLTRGRLVVLEQYPRILDRLMVHREPTDFPFPGMLITGSPGIGKTCCLWYLLIVHLCKAEPVVLLYENRLCIFTGSRLYALNKAPPRMLEPHVFRDVLCLVDMDAKGNSLWPAVLSRGSQCFTVAASSLQRENYHNWVKQNGIATVVLNALSNKDLMQLVPQSVDEETLDRLLNIYGPNIRQIAPLTRVSTIERQTAIEKHIIAIRRHLDGLDRTQLRYLFNSPDLLSNSFSHTLVHTYAEDVEARDQTVLHRIRTPLVLRLLVQSFQQLHLGELSDIYELFSATSPLAVPRNWVFEVLCHAKICEMDELILHPLSEHRDKLKKTDGAPPVRVYIGKPRMEIYEDGMGVEATVSAERYYVPAAGNNPTFNSFIPGEASLALQMSIAGTRTFKKKGVALFRKRLMAFDKSRDWKNHKMKFAFVIPTGYAFELPTSLNRPRDVNLFVLELDVAHVKFVEGGNCEVDDSDSDIDMDDE